MISPSHRHRGTLTSSGLSHQQNQHSPAKEDLHPNGSPSWKIDGMPTARRLLPLPERKVKGVRWSLGQSMAVAALCASLAAVMTALVAVHVLAYKSVDDEAATVGRSSRLSSSSFRGVGRRGTTSLLRPHAMQVYVPPIMEEQPAQALHDQADNDHVEMSTSSQLEKNLTGTAKKRTNGLGVAWLMSFPNSGTSFTLHMAREASNCTTATNYALEGEIRDEPSVAVIAGPAGEQGPWLELIPNRSTEVPLSAILTKTHCKGFCTGSHCGPDKTVQTVRSFMIGCLSGFRAVSTEKGIQKIPVIYDASLVTKAIHLFRHPLDNVVARFHLEYNVKKGKGDKDFVTTFPKNATGFQKWCAAEDRHRGLLRSEFVDQKLRSAMVHLPCFNEFFRYVQWHNLAFSVTRDLDLPTMILHYHEYADDFEKTRDRVLSFVGLPLIGHGIEFHPGKVYRHYYSTKQKRAIHAFLEEFASAETWQQIQEYDLELMPESV